MTDIVILALIATAVVLAAVLITDKRARAGVVAALSLLGIGWAASRKDEKPDEPKPTTYQPPETTHEKTDAKTDAVDDAFADADADAHDGAGSGVSDALDLLEERDADR